MRISEKFNLGVNQTQLDFVDIKINNDTPLFINPYFLSIRNDPWSINADRTIKSFFQQIIDLIKTNRQDEAKDLFKYLGEPKETSLGMGKGSSINGKGVGDNGADDILENMLKSKSIETGLVQDLEDSIIFVDNVSDDKVSDMVTNIIRKHLIDYTKEQCQFWNIPLTKNQISRDYWDGNTKQWAKEETDMLVIEGRQILLVPKGIVSYSNNYNHQQYYTHFISNFIRDEHLRLGTSLVKVKINKDGKKRYYVNKKDVYNDIRNKISNDEFDGMKEFVRNFTMENPDIFQKFKKNAKKDMRPLTNIELMNFMEEIDFEEFMDGIIKKLKNIEMGLKSANEYHKYVKGILELIFYPDLTRPVIEKEIHDGRKRIDIVFDNSAETGTFFNLHMIKKIPCPYIFMECKNYSRQVANPELDQLAGRFSVNRGQVGILLCRQIDNMKLFLNRCKDTYIDGRGLIIPLVDEELLLFLSYLKDGKDYKINDFLEDRIASIIL